MRLIDADALCMHLSDWQFGEMTDGKHDAEYKVINKVIDGIGKEPTVDAVSVVRCKECEWWERFGNDLFGNCEWGHGVTDIQFYCKDGERRENGHD